MANQQVVVPQGQWYRGVSCYAQYSSSSTSGSRLLYLAIENTSGGIIWLSAVTVTQGPSTIGYYSWSPNNLPNGNSTSGSVTGGGSLPDTLYAPGYTFLFGVFGADSQDVWQSALVNAEVYTEDYQTGTLVPVAPAPLLA